MKLNKTQMDFLKKYKKEFSNPTDENLKKVFENATEFGGIQLLNRALVDLGFKFDFSKFSSITAKTTTNKEPEPETTTTNNANGQADWSNLDVKLKELADRL